tara:strand:+ start:51 stop:260 length:210 start_codon:yes stop_codon:yes gene_type:complete
MVRVRVMNKQTKKLSPLGYQVTRLFKDACRIIEADDSNDNIIHLLTGTIKQLNRLLITYLTKPDRKDMN